MKLYPLCTLNRCMQSGRNAGYTIRCARPLFPLCFPLVSVLHTHTHIDMVMMKGLRKITFWQHSGMSEDIVLPPLALDSVVCLWYVLIWGRLLHRRPWDYNYSIDKDCVWQHSLPVRDSSWPCRQYIVCCHNVCVHACRGENGTDNLCVMAFTVSARL